RRRDRAQPVAAQQGRRRESGAPAPVPRRAASARAVVQDARRDGAVRPGGVAPARALPDRRRVCHHRPAPGRRGCRVIADGDVEQVARPGLWQRRPGLRRPALIVLALLGAWQLLTALQTSPFAWHDFTQDYVAAEDVLAGRNPYRPQNERIG